MRWQRPVPGSLNLNVDGSKASRTELIASGGVFRDEDGEWRAGFIAGLGKGTVLMAEIWAIFHGISMAVERGFTELTVDTDSAEALRFINRGCVSHPQHHLVEAIRDMLVSNPSISIVKISREQNKVADRIAKEGLSCNIRCNPLSEPPESWLCFGSVGSGHI